MKKLMTLLVAFFVAFSFATVTMAQAPAPAAKKMMRPKVKASKVTGEVTAVDAEAKTVTVKYKDKELTLMVTDKTRIAEGKAKKTLADISSGAKVTATFIEEGDKKTAKFIRISAGKKAAPKPEMSAPAPEKK
jgi:Cu/Ag efflux protein CusF